MHTKYIAVSLLACASSLAFAGCKNPQPVANAGASLLPVEFSEILSWLPPNTETLLTARGPFYVPQSLHQDYKDRETQPLEVRQAFEGLTLGPFALSQELQVLLKDKEILFAAEGSRAFRSPKGLGELPYEGCAIAIVSDDLGASGETFIKEASKSALKIEEIDGRQVAVFQRKLEEDVWTVFVTFPKKNVVAVATNREYLQEVLSRMRTPSARHAFPETLDEWKYIDTRAEFWGMRHFDRSQSRSDPTSPFGGSKPANLPDEKAIGLTFYSDPNRERKVTLVYLTEDTNGAKAVEQKRFPPKSEVKNTQRLHIEYLEVAPGVIKSTYELTGNQPMSWFMFVFMANMGHAVYV